MTAQALPKTQELADKINFLKAKKRKPTELEIRRLKKEADSLYRKISDSDYYDFLGQIASLENNKAEIISYYEGAIKLAPNDYRNHYNYVASLEHRGINYQQAKKLYEKFPNENSLRVFIRGCLFFCRFQEILDKLELNNVLNHPDYTLITSGVGIFENAELNDDEAQHLCELAYSVLETKNLYFSGSEIEIIEDCVSYIIYVDLPIEEIFEVNWELAGVFAENVEDMRSDILMFQYSSIDVLEEKQKYERIF